MQKMMGMSPKAHQREPNARISQLENMLKGENLSKNQKKTLKKKLKKQKEKENELHKETCVSEH